MQFRNDSILTLSKLRQFVFQRIHKAIALFFTILVLSFVCKNATAEVTHVACVGDSITFGAGITDRAHNSYPAYLGHLLGDGYKVSNFGVSGSTLLKKGDLPYWKKKAYANALQSNPKIVVVMLGANDSKPRNWKHKKEFAADYTELIQSFHKLPSKPRILLCLPIPAFREQGIRGSVIREMLPIIRKLAIENDCELIDLHTYLLNDSKMLPDGVHPNKFGAAKMARRVYETVRLKLEPTFDIQKHLNDALEKAATKNKSKTQSIQQKGRFHEYAMLRFTVAGRNAIVVKPHVTAQGRPWVWRARFWGHQPQFDLVMLERGWHVVYIDVAGMFGSPNAVGIWDAFYKRLVHDGKLAPKPFLEGMSRGGLIIYNWAKANPKKVAGIYGDNAVCDARSWPGGKNGKFSAPDWKKCLKEYGITEEEAKTFQGFPIDGLKPLAEAKVPLFNLIGTADKVVPPNENVLVLRKRYTELGGPIQTFCKLGKGHHPHCLPNPQPIVDFAMKATRQFIVSPKKKKAAKEKALAP